VSVPVLKAIDARPLQRLGGIVLRLGSRGTLALGLCQLLALRGGGQRRLGGDLTALSSKGAQGGMQLVHGTVQPTPKISYSSSARVLQLVRNTLKQREFVATHVVSNSTAVFSPPDLHRAVDRRCGAHDLVRGGGGACEGNRGNAHGTVRVVHLFKTHPASITASAKTSSDSQITG
jgi:hypothetical protein